MHEQQPPSSTSGNTPAASPTTTGQPEQNLPSVSERKDTGSYLGTNDSLVLRQQELLVSLQRHPIASLTDERVSLLSFPVVTARGLAPLRRLMDQDRENTKRVVFDLIADANMVSGGKCEPKEMVMFTNMVIQNFLHRPIEVIAMGIRDGLMRTDKDGKVYAKITWPLLFGWISEVEDGITRMAEAEHDRTVVKNDNGGKDWLDRQEWAAGGKDRTIEQLRAKLATEREKKKKD